MVTTRPSTDKKDFYLDLLPGLCTNVFPILRSRWSSFRQTSISRRFVSNLPAARVGSVHLVGKEAGRGFGDGRLCKRFIDFSLLDKFDASITDAYTFDGKTYGLPLGTSFLTTWYNKDMFAEVGYDTYPTNWDEFIDVCEKLKEAGHTPITCGDNSSFVIQFAMYQIGLLKFMQKIRNLTTSSTRARPALQMSAGWTRF